MTQSIHERALESFQELLTRYQANMPQEQKVSVRSGVDKFLCEKADAIQTDLVPDMLRDLFMDFAGLTLAILSPISGPDDPRYGMAEVTKELDDLNEGAVEKAIDSVRGAWMFACLLPRMMPREAFETLMRKMSAL